MPAVIDEVDAFGRSFGKAWTTWRQSLTPTPLPPQRVPRNEDPELEREAQHYRRQAIAEGRATPRPADDEVERARAERIAKAAADEETRLELRRAAKRSKPDEG